MFNTGSMALWQTQIKLLVFLIHEHLGDKKISKVFLEDIPAVYDYWPVACLLLYPGNTLHHIKKPHSIQRNWTLCPLREMEMEKIANFTTL